MLACACAGYESGVTSQFVSIDSNAGDCQQVPVALTGTYIADSSGYWAGKENFTYNLALYEFSFVNFVATTQEYASIIGQLAALLEYQSQVMLTSDLAVNLIYLQSGLAIFTSKGYNQMMQFSAVPGAVYNRNYQYVGFSEKASGSCAYLVTGLLNYATAEMTIVVDVPLFDIVCENATTNWAVLGYFNFANAYDFDFILDFRTFITAMGVNLGFRSLSTLEVVQIPDFTVADATILYNGKEYYIQQYFDPLYAGMTPFVCLTDYDTNDLYFCFLRKDLTFLLPLTNSFGGELAWSYYVPQYCNW
jgi:hypothetical protein